MENIRDYIYEKQWLERHDDARCSHLLAARFFRGRDEEHYCLTCRQQIPQRDIWESYVIPLYEDAYDPEVIAKYLEELDKEVGRLYFEQHLNPEFELRSLANYLFNFACAGFKDPFKALEEEYARIREKESAN